MVKMQVELNDKATMNLRIIKARYNLTNQEALNKIVEFAGSEF